MKNWRLSRWRWFLPLLHLHIQLPLLSITTMIMNYSDESQQRQFVALQVHFYKWHFEIELYDTHRRMQMREQTKENKE